MIGSAKGRLFDVDAEADELFRRFSAEWSAATKAWERVIQRPGLGTTTEAQG